INIIVGKTLCVLPETQRIQPFRNRLHGGHLRSASHPITTDTISGWSLEGTSRPFGGPSIVGARAVQEMPTYTAGATGLRMPSSPSCRHIRSHVVAASDELDWFGDEANRLADPSSHARTSRGKRRGLLGGAASIDATPLPFDPHWALARYWGVAVMVQSASVGA